MMFDGCFDGFGEVVVILFEIWVSSVLVFFSCFVLLVDEIDDV